MHISQIGKRNEKRITEMCEQLSMREYFFMIETVSWVEFIFDCL
jgi:hypothetical protein